MERLFQGNIYFLYRVSPVINAPKRLNIRGSYNLCIGASLHFQAVLVFDSGVWLKTHWFLGFFSSSWIDFNWGQFSVRLIIIPCMYQRHVGWVSYVCIERLQEKINRSRFSYIQQTLLENFNNRCWKALFISLDTNKIIDYRL